jgi:hypothetical protein
LTYHFLHFFLSFVKTTPKKRQNKGKIRI